MSDWKHQATKDQDLGPKLYNITILFLCSFLAVGYWFFPSLYIERSVRSFSRNAKLPPAQQLRKATEQLRTLSSFKKLPIHSNEAYSARRKLVAHTSESIAQHATKTPDIKLRTLRTWSRYILYNEANGPYTMMRLNKLLHFNTFQDLSFVLLSRKHCMHSLRSFQHAAIAQGRPFLLRLNPTCERDGNLAWLELLSGDYQRAYKHIRKNQNTHTAKHVACALRAKLGKPPRPNNPTCALLHLWQLLQHADTQRAKTFFHTIPPQRDRRKRTRYNLYHMLHMLLLARTQQFQQLASTWRSLRYKFDPWPKTHEDIIYLFNPSYSPPLPPRAFAILQTHLEDAILQHNTPGRALHDLLRFVMLMRAQSALLSGETDLARNLRARLLLRTKRPKDLDILVGITEFIDGPKAAHALARRLQRTKPRMEAYYLALQGKIKAAAALLPHPRTPPSKRCGPYLKHRMEDTCHLILLQQAILSRRPARLSPAQKRAIQRKLQALRKLTWPQALLAAHHKLERHKSQHRFSFYRHPHIPEPSIRAAILYAHFIDPTGNKAQVLLPQWLVQGQPNLQSANLILYLLEDLTRRNHKPIDRRKYRTVRRRIGRAYKRVANLWLTQLLYP